jgi:hypothetical protein
MVDFELAGSRTLGEQHRLGWHDLMRRHSLNCGAAWRVSMTLHVEMERLASLGPTLEGLAEEAGKLNSDLPMCPIPGAMEPAVLQASEIARDVVDSALVSTLKERLSETGEIMVNVGDQFRNGDDEALEVAMDTYTDATGDWVVPEVPR